MSAPRFSPDESRASALRRIVDCLAAIGLEEPRREARLLLCAALDISHAALISKDAEPLGGGAGRLAEWLARRLLHEPLSRIRGGREFRGRWFQTSPAVLDPRPETEILVEMALRRLEEGGARAPRILDLGSGSGAILVSLLAERPDATGVAVDISPEALDIARSNAERHDVLGRAFFCQGDLFAPMEGVFDLILSNPPYIPSADLSGLDPEVRDFDPAIALDGGADGLDFYRRIVEGAPLFLAEGGILALELGLHQAGAVRLMAEMTGFSEIALHPDLAGIERHLTARWKKT